MTADLPVDLPNVARMYDYYLGGHHNFEVDRIAAQAAMRIYPDLPLVMQTNRFFLRRAVKFLTHHGVDRFLDIGSGIPTMGSVHQVAQAANPNATTVYVDIDPVAVAQSTAMLSDNPRAEAITGDARKPGEIIGHRAVDGLLTPGKPVALLLIFLLHFVSDDQAVKAIVRTFHAALPAGSYVVITHATSENIPAQVREQMDHLYKRTSSSIKGRSRGEILDLFKGWQLVEPGLVHPPQWRPEDPSELFLDAPERSISLAGVARKV